MIIYRCGIYYNCDFKTPCGNCCYSIIEEQDTTNAKFCYWHRGKEVHEDCDICKDKFLCLTSCIERPYDEAYT